MTHEIPTPEDVRRRLNEEWTAESEALLTRCIQEINEAASTNITVSLGRESKAAINRVIIALRERKWLAEEDLGGGQRDPWHNLKISPLPDPRERPR